MKHAFGLLVALGFVTAATAQPARIFAGGVFVSEAEPMMRVHIDEAFEYLGRDQFILKEIAAVDRHYWVKVRHDTVRAMVVFQFEGLLDHAGGQYNFRPRTSAGANFRMTPDWVRLADHDYVHNTWAFDNRASAESAPEAESARAIRFMDEHGLVLPAELIMSRYVRSVGEDQRDEIILFYMEALSESGHTLGQFPDGQPATGLYDRLSEQVIARGLQAFQVLESGG